MAYPRSKTRERYGRSAEKKGRREVVLANVGNAPDREESTWKPSNASVA